MFWRRSTCTTQAYHVSAYRRDKGEIGNLHQLFSGKSVSVWDGVVRESVKRVSETALANQLECGSCHPRQNVDLWSFVNR